MKSWIALGVASLLTAPLGLADEDAPRQTRVIDLSLRRGESPDLVRGPVRLELVKLNRVKYRAVIGQQVTVLAPTDLASAGFIPKLPSPAAAATAAAAPPAAGTAAQPSAVAEGAPLVCPPAEAGFSAQLEAIRRCLRVEAHRVAALLGSSEAAASRLEARREGVLRLARESDQVLLADDGAALLAARVRAERMDIERDLGTAQADWPDPSQVSERRQVVESLAAALDDLPRTSDNVSWRDWLNVTDHYVLHGRTRKEIEDLRSSLAPLAADSDFVAGVEAVAAELEAWHRDLAALERPESYTMSFDVRCGYPYFQEKRIDYNLTLVDRTVDDPAKNKTVEKLVTVVCPSNLTVSAGVAAANIVERDFGFVPSVVDGALVNRIGLVNESDEQVNPVALISTRLLDLDRSGAYGLHATTGAVADYDNPEGGLRFGYLLGVSVSFKDRLLVTFGYQGTRVPRLAGGFHLDDVQPEGLASVPVTKEWELGWSLALTYALGGGS